MDLKTYKKLRGMSHKGSLREDLIGRRLVSSRTGLLRVGLNDPMNVFARIASGTMRNPLPQAVPSDEFVACQNLPLADQNWASTDPEWVGKASMGKRHRFITTTNLRWDYFNVLTIEDPGFLLRMRDYALESAEAWGWSDAIGLCFHPYPFNSVPSLHLHVLDMTLRGTTYDVLHYKNLALEDALEALQG